MKFVKGATLCLVLCLAVYGAYALFKSPPQIDISEGDFTYLATELGIVVQNGQAADSGLSSILGDVEGVPSVGGTTGVAFGSGGSSAPPSFLSGSTVSPPPFMGANPGVGAVHADPQPPTAVEVLPPLGYSEPADFPTQDPFLKTPSVEIIPQGIPLPSDLLPFETPRAPVETLPIAATESPPPWAESWDGPASGIPATPPPAEFLYLLTPPPSPIVNTHADTLPPPVQVLTVPQPIGENIYMVAEEGRDEEGVRRLGPHAPPAPALIAAGSQDRGHAFSSQESIPLEVATLSSARYTQTSSRQPPTFEPAKPTTSPTAPVVAFAPPRRVNQVQQPPEQVQQPEQPQPQPITSVPVAVVYSEVKQIGTPRLIENLPFPVAQPAIRETLERFVRSQQQLIESDDPDGLRQAFVHLSQVYELDQLADAERALMQPILDALALRVIYARGTHILEPPYRVKPQDTIESIANDFYLPSALLRKINGLGTSQELSVGTPLKVVYGQFDARISMQRKELTLLLGGLYAGRFSFSLLNENIPVRKGDYYVTNRTDQRIVLNNGWILATAYARDATIIFSDKDAREIFDILSEQSVIVLE